jgi:HEAT repeats
MLPRLMRSVALAGTILIFPLAGHPCRAQSLWDQIAELIGLRGKPEPASANVLSEHEIAELDGMAPQDQATLLLERSINHYRGANDQIAKRVTGWQGKVYLANRLGSLFTTALYSDDLRVRAAAIEIELASYNLPKTSASIDALENTARFGQPEARGLALWKLGLLGNRGVQPARAFEIINASIHDGNAMVRSWAVEGLAYLGTDATIEPLLGVFHDEPDPTIRENAACGLAQSGMLSEKQRRTEVPKLLDFAEDTSLDPKTREWVFQALRDITGWTLPHDPAVWRNWYNQHPDGWQPITRDEQ